MKMNSVTKFGRHIFGSFLWSIGNGMEINALTDPWLSTSRIYQMTTIINMEYQCNQIEYVH